MDSRSVTQGELHAATSMGPGRSEDMGYVVVHHRGVHSSWGGGAVRVGTQGALGALRSNSLGRAVVAVGVSAERAGVDVAGSLVQLPKGREEPRAHLSRLTAPSLAKTPSREF